MAARGILKLGLLILALPWIILSLALEVFGPKGLKADLDKCVELTCQLGGSVPSDFIDAAILAEDHRNELHFGVDVIAMIRAMWIRLSLRQVQGASTIEQQFVRVATNRRECTVRRKFREQMLALMLVRRISKHQIISTYLAIAFYGSGLIGLKGLRKEFGQNLNEASFNRALSFVAQLKYPRPVSRCEKWASKLEARVDGLNNLKVRLFG